ncbi:hypothetical protein BZA05DRAFT_385833 [Tricharina praecox]|uniref:uncharacterized protein n=1 Tax=Tricharina praecox TaxID=43433 RepID=UPI00221F2A02|nr:uncharacterized protein BZA05DRAFT_385833 [Tricharina praecox]KAI5858071.1 hypothetical protein BZA05DRAFT_385833 [Tricharina praecox]
MGKLVVDCDFFGMTSLYCAEDGAEVDIIAVTGLAGHAYGSWRSRMQNQMWLRDFLPPDMERLGHKVRILTYGYDCSLQDSDSSAGICDFAKSLLVEINGARTSKKERHRPIIFIAHSLGGLVVKQALVSALRGDQDERTILNAVTGLFFFGVPNCGLDVTNLMTLVKDAKNARFIDELGVGSHLLRHICTQFSRGLSLNDCHVQSFYELRYTGAVIVGQTYPVCEPAGSPCTNTHSRRSNPTGPGHAATTGSFWCRRSPPRTALCAAPRASKWGSTEITRASSSSPTSGTGTTCSYETRYAHVRGGRLALLERGGGRWGWIGRGRRRRLGRRLGGSKRLGCLGGIEKWASWDWFAVVPNLRSASGPNPPNMPNGAP